MVMTLETDWPPMLPMEAAPKDETWVLIKAAQAQSGLVLAFWSEEYGDWFDSEAGSYPASHLYGPFLGWWPLPVNA